MLVRHEQGAGHAATGYAQATGRVGVCMATSGPGATNLVTPIADAQMDSVPMVAITGQVGRVDDRHRRLPGGRHLRHHDADHQTQLPRHRSGRDPTNDRGRVPPGSDRPTRRRAGGHPEGRAAVGDHLRLAAGRSSPRLPADHAAAFGADHRRRQADRCRAPSGALRRWRGVEGPGDRGPSTAGRADRYSGRHHAHGSRRLPGLAHPAHRDAGHARHRDGSGGHAARGRHRRARRPVRRSGHRPAINVRARARRSSTPTSTRPRSARTGSPTCRSSATPAR